MGERDSQAKASHPPEIEKIITGMINFWQNTREWRESDRDYLKEFRLSHCNNIALSLETARQGHRQANQVAIVLGDLVHLPACAQDMMKETLKIVETGKSIKRMQCVLREDRRKLHGVKAKLSEGRKEVERQQNSISAQKSSSQSWSNFFGTLSSVANQGSHLNWYGQTPDYKVFAIPIVGTVFGLAFSYLQGNEEAKIRGYNDELRRCAASIREIENMIKMYIDLDAYLGHLIRFWTDAHEDWDAIIGCLKDGAGYGGVGRRFETIRDTFRSYEAEVSRLEDHFLAPQ